MIIGLYIFLTSASASVELSVVMETITDDGSEVLVDTSLMIFFPCDTLSPSFIVPIKQLELGPQKVSIVFWSISDDLRSREP